MNTVWDCILIQHSIMFLLRDAFQSSGHGFIWQTMGQDVSLYLVSPLDSEVPVCKNSSTWFPLLYTDVVFFPPFYMSHFIYEVPNYHLESVQLCSLLSSVSASLTIWPKRDLESSKEFEFKFFHPLAEWPGKSLVAFLRRSFPTYTPFFRECPWAVVSVNVPLKR